MTHHFFKTPKVKLATPTSNAYFFSNFGRWIWLVYFKNVSDITVHFKSGWILSGEDSSCWVTFFWETMLLFLCLFEIICFKKNNCRRVCLVWEQMHIVSRINLTQIIVSESINLLQFILSLLKFFCFWMNLLLQQKKHVLLLKSDRNLELLIFNDHSLVTARVVFIRSTTKIQSQCTN